MMKIWLMLAALASVANLSASNAGKRHRMVEDIRRVVGDAAPAADDPEMERVLAVISRIPREEFVPKAARAYAYIPVPIDIGYGQTISDAYVQAVMTAALHLPANADVLDIGTGSGYQAAILAPLAKNVSSIEIVRPLAAEARKRLHRLGYRNIEVRAGDGFAGWTGHAPFDGIVVAAGAADIPQPLLDQLKPGGRIVMPIGPSLVQEQLIVATKSPGGTITRCSLGLAMFVPLTGRGQRTPGMRGLIDRSVQLCYGAPVT